MKMNCAAVALLLLSLAGSLAAHHGTGGIYDMEKPITMKGAVKTFKFVNPHVQIYFDAPDARGAVVTWLRQGPSVVHWTRTGCNPNWVKAGDQVTVTLFPARSGKPEGVLRKIITANGKQWCCEWK